jgi:hypothetical protein
VRSLSVTDLDRFHPRSFTIQPFLYVSMRVEVGVTPELTQSKCTPAGPIKKVQCLNDEHQVRVRELSSKQSGNKANV